MDGRVTLCVLENISDAFLLTELNRFPDSQQHLPLFVDMFFLVRSAYLLYVEKGHFCNSFYSSTASSAPCSSQEGITACLLRLELPVCSSPHVFCVATLRTACPETGVFSCKVNNRLKLSISGKSMPLITRESSRAPSSVANSVDWG